MREHRRVGMSDAPLWLETRPPDRSAVSFPRRGDA